MSRMATLFHLAHDRPWRALVVPAAGLARKVVPRRELGRRADRIVAEGEMDREALVRWLVEAGYLRVPVVEDPGSFAVRGALLDVWAPSSALPVRVELYGELVLSLRPFDPGEQKTRKDAPELKELWLPPAREAILDGRTTARARARISQLADAIDWPTTKTRALVDDVVCGRAFFGAEGFLPAYYEDLDPLLAYVPDDAVVVLDDPPSLTRAIRDELERAHDDPARTVRAFCPRRSSTAKRPSPRRLPPGRCSRCTVRRSPARPRAEWAPSRAPRTARRISRLATTRTSPAPSRRRARRRERMPGSRLSSAGSRTGASTASASS
jgi:transcription-repair coupling factor (superfamily II helicase)